MIVPMLPLSISTGLKAKIPAVVVGWITTSVRNSQHDEALPGEIYSGIGRGEIKIEGLPVFADQLGPFGSTTSDSERTMVQLETIKIMMVIISFLGAEGLDAALGGAMGLLERYVAASGIERGMVE